MKIIQTPWALAITEGDICFYLLFPSENLEALQHKKTMLGINQSSFSWKIHETDLIILSLENKIEFLLQGAANKLKERLPDATLDKPFLANLNFEIIDD